jgi:beta-galactosidase
VRVMDKNRLTVPTAKNPITFELEGDGEIVATDNGDATNLVPFPSHVRDAFNGLALVIVRSKPHASGPITVTARAAGLKYARVVLNSK